MIRTTLRAVACALTLAVAAAGAASAAPGDAPTTTNETTGGGGAYPGEIAVGDALRGASNDWAGSGVYVYQWNRCMDQEAYICDAIPNATNTGYTVAAADWGAVLQFSATAPR